VLAGLQGGEQVIINPTDDVREGAQVKPAASREQGGAPGASSPPRQESGEQGEHNPQQ